MQKAYYVSETERTKQTVHIATEKKDIFVQELKKKLMHYDMDVFLSQKISDTSSFDFIFLIGTKQRVLENKDRTRIIHILFHKKRGEYSHRITKKGQKVIHIIGNNRYAVSQIEKILWFAIDKNENATQLILEDAFSLPEEQIHHPVPHIRIRRSFSPRHIMFISIVLLVSALVAFFIPLGLSTYYSFKTAKSLSAKALKDAGEFNAKQSRTRNVSELLYAPVRPFYLFFSLARFPDDLILINRTIGELYVQSEKLLTMGNTFAELIVTPNKSDIQLQKTRALFAQITKSINQVEDKAVLLNQKIPFHLFSKDTATLFQNFISQLRKGKKSLTVIPELLGDPTEKKILILFANNMEIRPGGGFIGSFGILHTKKFGIESLDVYDVYDADGQLTAHIDPPLPIRQYLGQPHWFLRDSAFFPDFYDTYQQAVFFLQKEMNFTGWDGGILLTTSAVKEIVGSFGTIFLPDYGEKITKDNFYIKTQFHAENDFFPGSTQKKSFLSSLIKHIFAEIQTADVSQLSSAVIQTLDQKNIVAYFDNPEIQKKIDDLYWNGRTVTPFCPANVADNCFADYQYILDANLGVNKANFFIDRTFKTSTNISEQGLTTTTVEIYYKNSSISNLFPGGIYNNYFQILLPSSSLIQEVSIDNVQISQYDSQTGKHKQLGFMVVVPPQSEKVVRIRYQSSTLFKKGRAVYQLVIQKQIGAQQNDLSFSLQLPHNMNLVHQNFSPLVKQGQIIYNTDLSTDRVLYIELLKE